MRRLTGNCRLRVQGRLAALGLAAIADVILGLPQTSIAEQNEPIVPIPLSKNIDPQRVAFGERLFNDVRLSHDSRYSCASCHPLDRGGMDGLPVAKSPAGDQQPRNTLTVFNVGLNPTYNWDGIANSLEQHTDLILANPGVMNITWSELLAKIGGDARYASAFKWAYRQGLTRATVSDAIASFERSLLTPNSRFDRYLRGQRDALTAREKEGIDYLRRTDVFLAIKA